MQTTYPKKGLIPRIYEALEKCNSSKTNNPFRTSAKTKRDTSPKKIHR